MRAINEIPNYNIGFLCTDWQIIQRRGNKTALKWISSSQELHEFSYNELTRLSNKAANVLKSQGAEKEDRVMILLPKIPELYFYFLGALKLGLNCCILFSSIGEDSLIERIRDTETKIIISNSKFGYRLNKILPKLGEDTKVLMVDGDSNTEKEQGVQNEFLNTNDKFETQLTSPAQYSHFHFTSGSTGRPKGVQHVHGSVKNHLDSFLEVMQPEENDIFWCTADPGWVTGVTYGIIAPWINGTTQIQTEANYDPEIWMSVIDKYKVNILYSAPTVFRMLMQKNDEFFIQFDLSSIKRVYCVGEPLNPVLIEWGRRIFNTEIYDTWFQTETGSIMISNRPGIEVHPGSMGKPLSYIQASIIDEKGNKIPSGVQGLLCINKPWSSMFREYINNPRIYQKKFIHNFYSSGDIAYQDQEGYFWFIGRSDDVINTAGHLVSPFEVESVLLESEYLVDVAVVGVPDPILFEKIIAFVILKNTKAITKAIEMEIKLLVSKKISTIAAPKEVVFVITIPKTKSGKIMRRVLKNQYLKKDVGDTSTMEEG